MRALLALLQALPCVADGPWVGTTNGWDPYRNHDKGLHFATGVPGGALVYYVAKQQGATHPYLWVIGTGLLVGFGKEVYDHRHKGHSAETADALNTAAGFALGGMVVKVSWRF